MKFVITLRRNFALRCAVTIPLVLFLATNAPANPTGLTVSSGAASVNQSGSQLTITASQNAFLNWNTFNIAAGETTVTVRGDGIGGRNQEIALAAALLLRDEQGILLTSFATDGKEGNSNAAGAYASGATAGAGERAGLDAGSCLERNDSNAFLTAAGDLIVTGPTGTNVNDISFVLVDKR